ncbi:MAG: HNH endonuclease [Alphaproteobacteria bacterium]|nr:HNH endonuclease [Alphaproteobacteria bacterium]
MPAVSPSALVSAVIDGFQQSGASAYFVSEMNQGQPRKFVADFLGGSFSAWIYIWTLTHGGRQTLPDEFRIQMTSVASPLALNPSGHTALLGYYPDLQMFAGFDLAKHRIFTTGSPSIQIDINTLHQALQTGLSFHTKTNDEIAVGVRPDQLVNYIVSAEVLHRYGAGADITALLNRAADPTKTLPSIDQLGAERQKIVTEVSRYSRNANFRKAVLNAYDNRCAVTRAQMKLVEAAHILPVPAEGSSDHVSNGIALSPTLHRAYDNCLIFLDPDLVMRLNAQRAKQLVSEGLDAGLDTFRALLDRPIHLPQDRKQRPRREFIERANHYRRIPGF